MTIIIYVHLHLLLNLGVEREAILEGHLLVSVLAVEHLALADTPVDLGVTDFVLGLGGRCRIGLLKFVGTWVGSMLKHFGRG